MNSDILFNLFKIAGKLKTIKRAGWLNYSLKNPESVADHSYRVAFMAMIMSDFIGLDTEKIIRMAIVHDLGEIKVGDITPHMGIPKSKKHKMEKEALKQLFAKLPTEDSYYHLWDEYERGESPEAKLLRDIDKLEMAFQALEYSKEMPNKNFDDFFLNAQATILNQNIKDLLCKVKSEAARGFWSDA